MNRCPTLTLSTGARTLSKHISPGSLLSELCFSYVQQLFGKFGPAVNRLPNTKEGMKYTRRRRVAVPRCKLLYPSTGLCRVPNLPPKRGKRSRAVTHPAMPFTRNGRKTRASGVRTINFVILNINDYPVKKKHQTPDHGSSINGI